MPGEWWAESGIDSSSNHAFVSGTSRGPRFRSSRSRLMNQQTNNAEERAFLKASQTLAERERQRFHLHLRDIVRLVRDDRGSVIDTLLEQGVIEERRKKRRNVFTCPN